MDNKEAILRFKDHMEVHGIGTGYHIKIKEALCMAIKALENNPLHIDREKWEPCKVCRSPGCTTCKCFGIAEHLNPCFGCWNNLIPNNYKPTKFCPDCGRPLTDEAWAELQKRLEGMMDA